MTTTVNEKNTENTEVKNTEKTGPDKRVPSVLAKSAILGDICKQYLNVLDEIAAYNKEVLAEKSSDWTSSKVLEKARELGRPADPKATPNEKIKESLVAYENAVEALAFARKALLGTTAEEIGITLTATAERNPEMEAPLKEKRKLAIDIGSQLSMISKMTSDESASTAVNDFLKNNELPAIGRDQTRSFTDGGKTTPKYRVTVKVYKDGNEVLSEDGFTKAALALTKPAYGYERGAAPKSDVLRAAWEKAGNTVENTVVNPVEFDDNDLHYVITKK